jgi:hypothetical protein
MIETSYPHTTRVLMGSVLSEGFGVSAVFIGMNSEDYRSKLLVLVLPDMHYDD